MLAARRKCSPPSTETSAVISHSDRSAVNTAARARELQLRQATLLLPKRSPVGSFTLIELLNSAASITSLSYKQIDADSQARQLLDRMALDFAQMIKRADVDYYLKSPATSVPDCTTCTVQSNGNDRIAFFGATSGYYPTPSYQSPVSLIAYRINSDSTSSLYNKLERMGKGFIWNGVSPSYTPIPFLDNPTPTTTPTTATTILGNWPAAVSPIVSDSAYEVAGSLVFRFEY
jgi:hypothetical protein